MKSSRLSALLILLGAVLFLRWWDPLSRISSSTETNPVVGATDRRVTPSLNRTAEPAAADNSSFAWPLREPASAATGNVFGARTMPPEPKPVAPPPRIPAPTGFVGPLLPPPPPPEPPPPLQVIGTWNDGHDQGVFIQGPNGTLMAHVGDNLLGQYRVEQITSDHITVVRSAPRKEWVLPISSPPSPPNTWPGR